MEDDSIMPGQENEPTDDFATLKNLPNLTYLDLKDVVCKDSKTPNNAFGKNDMIYEGSANTKIATIILPENIITIGHAAFYHCTGLTSITMPNRVETIGVSAFNGCMKLNGNIVLPANLKVINNYAFQECTSIKGLEFGDKIEQIDNRAFLNCSSIVGSVVFPISLNEIYVYAFAGCTGISAFRFANTLPIRYNTEMFPTGKPVTVPTTAAVGEYITKWGANAERHSITAILE